MIREDGRIKKRGREETFEEGGATGEVDVGIQVLAKVKVDLGDGLDEELVHAQGFISNHLRVEENLRGSEALLTNLDKQEEK